MMNGSSNTVPILLVEDEPLLAFALMDSLEERGYHVSVCGTGIDAINFIEMEDCIAAVVTDIRLGNGPDGWEVARCAREHFPGTPVVYITGDSAGAFASKKVPESILLQKPFPLSSLIDAVSALVH